MQFLISIATKFKSSMARVPYNKLLTNLACSSCTGEYWPLVVSCMDLAVLPRPWANIPQYGPCTGLERGYYFLLAVKLRILCKAIPNPSASYSCDFLWLPLLVVPHIWLVVNPLSRKFKTEKIFAQCWLDWPSMWTELVWKDIEIINHSHMKEVDLEEGTRAPPSL